MKKIIKKVIKETIEDKRLRAAYVWFSVHMDNLEEIVKNRNTIQFREYGHEYVKVAILKNDLKCWVTSSIWINLAKEYSLDTDEIKLVVSKWVEHRYRLKDINVRDF